MAETPLEKSMECITNIFRQYSTRVDGFNMLSKGELRQLLEQQLPNYLKGVVRSASDGAASFQVSKKNKDPINRLFEELDKNKDRQVSFDEFVDLVSRVLILNNDGIN